MAEEQNKESVLGGLRSRLPKFFSESEDEAAADASGGLAPRETAVTSSPPVAPKQSAPGGRQSATRATEGQQRKNAAAKSTATSEPLANTMSTEKKIGGAQSMEPATSANISVEEAHLQHMQYLVEEFGEVQTELQRMYQLVEEISEREKAHERVFDTLHAELRDYKTDFIYEHLKPVIRPLLFLYDSLEQFDAEIALYERPTTGERRQSGLSPQLVRENISFFRDQLVEALRICEVTPMEAPKGAFNPKLHKVIDVVPAEAAQDGMIQRVVRSGWYLNGQLLRSAEVIVGKKMA